MADQRPEPDMRYRYKGSVLYVYAYRSSRPPYSLRYRVTWPPVGDVIPGCTISEAGLERLEREARVVEPRRAVA